MLHYIEKGDRRTILYQDGTLLRVLGRHRISDERRIGYWLGAVRELYTRGGCDVVAYSAAWGLLEAYNSDTGTSLITMPVLRRVSVHNLADTSDRLLGRRVALQFTETEYLAGVRQLARGGLIRIERGGSGRGLRGMNVYHLHLPTAEKVAEIDAQTTTS